MSTIDGMCLIKLLEMDSGCKFDYTPEQVKRLNYLLEMRPLTEAEAETLTIGEETEMRKLENSSSFLHEIGIILNEIFGG